MRMHLKRIKRKKRIGFIFILSILLILVVLMNQIGKNLSKIYLSFAEEEAIEIIDSSLNKAVSDKILKEFKNINLYNITKNSENEIETIDYNSYLVNDLLNKISTNLYNNVKTKEKDISFYIPSLSFTNNPLLADKGPKIPVKLKLLGSVLSEIKTTVKPCGINSSLIEMTVHIEVKEKVLLPITSKKIKVKNEIPISYKIINGKIPTYYGESISKNTPIYSLPIE